jgi:uncharacterized protein YndB with AHSA1/START domain
MCQPRCSAANLYAVPTGLASAQRWEVSIVATVSVEVAVDAPAQRVWEAIADVGAVHRRLLPGRVADVRIEGDVRILTMPDGAQVRELILAVDDSIRRLAYAVVEGQRLPLTYHHAAFQVFDEGDHSRLVWLTDVLPHTMADAVRARVERGIEEMKEVLERNEPER